MDVNKYAISVVILLLSVSATTYFIPDANMTVWFIGLITGQIQVAYRFLSDPDIQLKPKQGEHDD